MDVVRTVGVYRPTPVQSPRLLGFPAPMASALDLVLALAALPHHQAQAHPYASAVTNDSGTIRFILNEAGGTVAVTFEDSSTLALGVLGKGPQSFSLGAHTSYAISVNKVGAGSPTLISTDTSQFSVWNSPRGVAVNKSPKLGNLFGRIYAGNTAGGGSGNNFKGLGLYAMNADQTEALGKGTNATATSLWVGNAGGNSSAGSSPWRMRVAPDNSLLVDDSTVTNASLWQFSPNLSSSNLVLTYQGQAAAVAAGIHGDLFGTPLLTGSPASNTLVLWTADSGMAAPATATKGPGTHTGDYNCLFRYNIGSGPLPWNQPPDYAYSMGLGGFPELRT